MIEAVRLTERRNGRHDDVDAGQQVRALHVIDNLRVGGAQRLLVTLAKHYGATNPLEVMDLRGQSSALTADMSHTHAIIISVSVSRLLSPRSLLQLAKGIRARDGRIVHLHLTYSTILGALAAKLVGRRVVVTLHNVETVVGKGLKAFLLRELEGVVLRRLCDHIIFVGDFVEQSNRSRCGSTPQTTLHNVIPEPSPINAETSARLRSQLGASERNVVVLATGRLNAQKDHATLLLAFCRVAAACPEAMLWIAGTGSLATELKQLAAQLGVADRVSFLGARSDIPALLEASDVFALSSVWEGLPIGLLEAMAASRAVVATRVGDVPTVLPENAARIVPPEDPETFAGALIEICLDPKLRRELGGMARRAAEPYTDVGKWENAVHDIYRGVLSRG